MQRQLKTAFDKVDRLSKHDTLTACLNRTGFFDALQITIERTRRYARPFSLVYFDCDNFKHVNDTLGHHVGDSLLVQVGATLRDRARRVDFIARLGGDEFAILIPEADAAAAKQAVAHVRTQLDAAMRAMKWPVTFSIGVATFEGATETVSSEAMSLTINTKFIISLSNHARATMR